MYLVLPAAIMALATALTLQPWRWLWQARVLAALVPWAGLALLPVTGGPVVGLALIGLTFWLTIRALQSLLPVTIGQFVADIKPQSEGSVLRLMVQEFTCWVLLIVLLFRSDDEKGLAKAQAREAGRDQRNRLREGIRDSRKAFPAALAWRRTHWAGFIAVFGVWVLLMSTHLGTFASIATLAVPVVLLTVALVEYQRVEPVQVVPRGRRAAVIKTIEN